MSILMLALFMTVLTACGTSGAVNSGSVSGTKSTSNTSTSSSVAPAETADQQAAKKTTENFFAAFSKEDYATMKTYCTKQFVKKSFGKNKKTEYWCGYKNATLEEANLMTKDADAFRTQLFPNAKTGYLFDVTMKGETVPQSSSWVKEHPVQEDSCTLLIQKVDGNWKLADMTSE